MIISIIAISTFMMYRGDFFLQYCPTLLNKEEESKLAHFDLI